VILTRSITHKINTAPGSYEGLEISGTVVVDTDELPDHLRGDEALAEVQRLLDVTMEEDLIEAARCVQGDDSYVLSWKDGK
jgi:hypothetical protein